MERVTVDRMTVSDLALKTSRDSQRGSFVGSSVELNCVCGTKRVERGLRFNELGARIDRQDSYTFAPRLVCAVGARRTKQEP